MIFGSVPQEDTIYNLFYIIPIPDDKVPQPLVKHLSSVESAGKYDAEEGKHAACTLLPNVNGESNLAMTQSLLVV